MASMITNLKQINTALPEGKLFMAALAILTTEIRRDKTPDEVIAECVKLTEKMYPAAPCRVKITKCSYDQGWYKDLVGEEFDVDNAGGGYDYVLWEDYTGEAKMWRHIKQDDCVRVNRQP